MLDLPNSQTLQKQKPRLLEVLHQPILRLHKHGRTWRNNGDSFLSSRVRSRQLEGPYWRPVVTVKASNVRDPIPNLRC